MNRKDIVQKYTTYLNQRLSYLHLNVRDGPILTDRDYLLVCVIEEMCEAKASIDIFTIGELSDMYGSFCLLTLQEMGCLYKIRSMVPSAASDKLIVSICGLLRHKVKYNEKEVYDSIYEWLCAMFTMIAEHFGMDVYDFGYLIMTINMIKLIGRDFLHLPMVYSHNELNLLLADLKLFQSNLLSGLSKDNPLQRLSDFNLLLEKGEKIW